MRTVLVLLTVSLVSCMTSGASKAGSLSETFKRVAPAVVVVKTQQRQLDDTIGGRICAGALEIETDERPLQAQVLHAMFPPPHENSR